MEFIEKFEKLKKKFAKADTSKITDEFAIQVNMTDADCGGAFYIAYINGEFSVEPYDYRDHTAMITSNAADFEKIMAGKLSLGDATANGRAYVEGNAEHIAAAAALFAKPAKRTPAKKAPAKKAAAKKAPAEKAPAKKSPAKKATGAKTETAKTASAEGAKTKKK